MGTFAAVLGKAIAERRRQMGLSQERLAYRCGLHQSYISQLENGVKSPTVRSLAAIAHALDTRPSELLREAEEEAAHQGVPLADLKPG